MDRTTRHDLKSDKFVQEVAHSVEFVEQHRDKFIRYGALLLVLVAAGAGIFYFMKSRKEARVAELSAAMQTYNTTVGPEAGNNMRTFPTEEARQLAVKKEFTAFIDKNSGSEEAGIANYLLGTNAADQGNTAEARKYLEIAIKDGGKNYSSLAQLALAGVANAEGKQAEAEKLLRELIKSPTVLVSKEQATITLASILAPTKPAEARKLLEPLRTETGAVSRTAITMLAELGQGM